MKTYERKSGRDGGESDDSNSHMPHLPSLSSGESEISPHFRHAAENLSDSDDESQKSGSSGVNNTTDDESLKSSHSSGYYSWPVGSSSSSPSTEQPSSNNGSRKRHNRADKEDEVVATTKKKKKLENRDATKAGPIYGSAAQKMMKKMGFKEGGGLGKYGQGRVAPIEESKQKGRRGLGLVIADVDRALIHYDPAQEFKEVHEVPIWLTSGGEIELPTDELLNWVVVGPKKLILDDETHFCEAEVLKLVLICKSAFDKMSGEEMRRARNRSNPYELIKKGPYQNRAAMKMANMDSVFDEMFTKPVDEFGNEIVSPDELLYFADVCAGPGGFSEYVLSKKKWRAKGFGFTLKGDNDFKLADFYAGPCESFEPHYGKYEDGDVYKSENIISFSNYVHEHTGGQGVHFMMADGGFSVEGSENIQEIKSKRIYLCQFLVALSIVRPNGHFVCKLFDVFTPFSAGLVFIMSRCFKMISIHKPNTSRPANSERYIICKWRHNNVDHVRDYFLAVNKQFDQYGDASEKEINEIVPLDILKNDKEFYDYLWDSNNSLGRRQINSLAKILQFSEDETLVEEKQQQLKKECMEAWGVQIKARSGPSFMDPEVLARNLLKNDMAYLRNLPNSIQSADSLEEFMKSIHDWHAIILGADSKNGTAATFFLGVSHKKCYKLDRSTKRWCAVQDPHFEVELSPETLVYGEIVPEVKGEWRSQMKKNVLHIIDGHTLGGEPIGHYHYTDRIRQCALYASSLNRPSMNTLMSIRVKDTYEMDELEENSFYSMRQMIMKNGMEELAVPLSCDDFYVPKGIMFLKSTRSPFIRWISQQHQTKYYWAPKSPPVYDKDRPKEASNDFKTSYEKSKVWFMNKDEDRSPFNAQQFVKELVHYVRKNKFTKRVQ